MDRIVLLASFIFEDRLEWFLTYLETEFDIKREHVFVFKNLNDPNKLIITFKFKLKPYERVNFKDLFPNAMLVHKRGNTIYTINALNKLIASLNTESLGNIDFKSVKIDWSKYQNLMLIINNDELNFLKIQRYLYNND